MTKRAIVANSILLGLVLVLVLSLALVVSQGGHFPDWSLTPYYALFLGGIAVLLAALSVREELKVNLSLLLLSLLTAAYLAEAVLQAHDREPLSIWAAARNRRPAFDSRTMWQAVNDLRKTGVRAYPRIVPGRFVSTDGLPLGSSHIFPLAGLANTTTVLGNESGQYVVYLSDEHGFNNPSRGGRDGEPLVVLIGDSFVHGAVVRPGEDLASWLRLSGYNATNLGMYGDGPLLELATLKEYAEPVRPLVVLWVYFEGNDLSDLAWEEGSPTLRRYLGGQFTQHLFARQTEVDSAIRQFIDADFARSDALHKVLRLTNLRALLGLPDVTAGSAPTAPVPLLGQVLGVARDLTASWGGRLYFVYLPDPRQRYRGQLHPGSFLHRDAVLALARGLRIPVIDVDRALLAHGDVSSLLPFGIGPHFNACGYQVIGAFIADNLRHEVRMSHGSSAPTHSGPLLPYGSPCVPPTRVPQDRQ